MIRWSVLAIVLAGCTADTIDGSPPVHDEWDDKLADRVVDYNAALRIAALRLTGELPTLAEIQQIADLADLPAKKSAYEGLVHGYLASPRFARQMFRFWQDALKMGDAPELDSAAAFVAELVVDNRSYLEVLTATHGTCPTFSAQTGQFTPHDCANGAPVTVGLLTHPGMHKQFFSNLGFRRVRWVQETFACTKFPAEIATTATDVGGTTPYTGTFPFTSIAGTATGGRVDFRDTTSVVCANCHSNINHIAPLFGHYDENGSYQPTIVVPTPLPDNPAATLTDYLPPGEGLAWRHGVPVTDMASLGATMAADPAISECAVARIWNWALGKSDIVDSSTRVPPATIAAHVHEFAAGGGKLRDVIFAIFTSDDFVTF